MIIPEWAKRLIYSSDGDIYADNGIPEWPGYRLGKIGKFEELPLVRMPEGDWQIVNLETGQRIEGGS